MNWVQGRKDQETRMGGGGPKEVEQGPQPEHQGSLVQLLVGGTMLISYVMPRALCLHSSTLGT